MKKNLPVTQQAISMNPDLVIVSHTDLKGMITYANRAFTEVSGYSVQELIGVNHNMVRHPDVPSAFFEDLWSTIQAGQPWTGIVKNRAKNGDHYWVVANVAPFYENGEITGYISVRKPASAEQIVLAEELYGKADAGEIGITAGIVYAVLRGRIDRINPVHRLGVRTKLVALFLMLSLVPLAIFGSLADQGSRSALEEQTMAKLESVAANKRAGIERYFKTIHDQIRTFAEDRMVVDAMLQFREMFPSYRDEIGVDSEVINSMRPGLVSYYKDQFAAEYLSQNGKLVEVDPLITMLDDDSIAMQYNFISNNEHSLGDKHQLDNPGDDSTYSQIHAIIHPVIRNFLETFGYYDIFLVDPDSGDIIYSVFKELDFSTSLLDGPYAETNFGEVFRKANTMAAGQIAFSDYRQYVPSYDAPASFIGSPIYDDDQKIGVLIFQMPLDRITEVMAVRDGLGESGESYLVGMDHLMRSDAFLDENHSVVNSFRNPEKGELHNPAIDEALIGNSGIMTTSDYRQVSVLSAYMPVNISEGVVWGMEAKIDVEEAFASIDALALKELVLSAVIMLVVLLLSTIASQFIAGSMRDVVMLLSRIREGKLDNSIVIKGEDEIQQMRAALQITQVKLGSDLDQIQSQAEDATRVKVALDHVSTNVMVADRERNIIYTNYSVIEMLRHNEKELQKVLPHFSAEGLVGKNIDIFHQRPEHQAALLEKLTALYESRIEVGPLFFDLKASPVIDKQRGRLGTAVEWKDVTEQVNAEKQLESLVSGATQGQLGNRLDCESYEGFMKSLGCGINQMMDAIEQPVSEVAEMVGKLAQGELRHTMEGEYAGQFKVLQEDINAMTRSLNGVIQEVIQSTNKISQGANEISQGSANLSDRTQNQAASVEETAASMEEMTATVDQNSGNASRANELSREARQLAEQGSEVMAGAVSSMKEMHEASAKIADIISTIDGISFQTNLLALNAAVEAARAGDHGRGFAVVAGEVRSLAQRSAESAKEIKSLIEDSIDKIEQGTSQVNNAGDSLSKIVTSVQQVSAIVGEIAEASSEQADGISQVNRAVSELDNTTQQNAALVEETAASSEDMSHHANALRDRVKYFKV